MKKIFVIFVCLGMFIGCSHQNDYSSGMKSDTSIEQNKGGEDSKAEPVKSGGGSGGGGC